MDLIGIKEKIDKIRFFLETIRYKRGKNLYVAIFFLILLVSTVFSIVLIVQKKEISKKDNILKSYFDVEKSDISAEDNLIENDTSSADNSNNSFTNNNLVNNNNASGGDINSDSKNSKEDINSFNENDTGKEIENKITIKAYICGYVVNPGVYEFENGLRVIDLLNKAGGPKKEACLEAINLALLLSDCQRIYVPSFDEVKKGKGLFFSINDYISLTNVNNNNNSSSNSNGLNNTSVVQLININMASAIELESLPGIGSKTAKEIIDYRNKYGFFKNKEDIKSVKGIGDKKYEKIKDLISV
jgi:competence protein ComEA